MLYTDTDLFVLHFTVDNLSKEINSRPQLQNTFNFSEIKHSHISQLRSPGGEVHFGEFGFFKNKTKRDQIGEFVALRLKMYSFTVCRAT